MGLLDDAIREHLELKRRRGADAVDISRQESEALGPVRRFPDGAPDLPDTFEPPQDDAQPSPSQDATAALEPVEPETAYEPPTAAYTPPVQDTGYEPPAAPAYEPPPTAAAPERVPLTPVPDPEPEPEPEPEPPSPEPAWRAYLPQREPDPPTAEPHPEPEPEPESDPWSLGPDPAPQPSKAAEPPSRFSRLRIGRRSTKPDPVPHVPSESPADDDFPAQTPSPPAHSSFAPPGAPGGFEPASPYEPPPVPPSRGYEPPPAAHEPDIVPADDEGEAEDVLEETPDFLEETPEHDRLWFEQRPPRDFNFDD